METDSQTDRNYNAVPASLWTLACFSKTLAYILGRNLNAVTDPPLSKHPCVWDKGSFCYGLKC